MERGGFWLRVLPPELAERPESLYRARALILASTGIAALGATTLLQRLFAIGVDLVVGLACLVIIGCLLVPYSIWWTRSERMAGLLLTIILAINLPLVHMLVGVFPAPVLGFFPIAVLVAVLFAGSRTSVRTLGYLVIVIVALASFYPATSEATLAPLRSTFASVSIVSALLTFLITYAHESSLEAAARHLARINLDLERARAESNAANRAKSVFLANMSHELRTPLNAIIGYSELLHEEMEDDEKPQHYLTDLQRIYNAGEQLLRLVNGVLHFSKLEAGAVHFKLSTFDLGALLAELKIEVMPSFNAHENRLALTVGGELATVCSDQEMLRQALSGLLRFASRVTRAGAIALVAERVDNPPHVLIETRVQGCDLEATDPDLDEQLFEPFAQLPLLNKEAENVGLDLAIARRCITLVGGQLDFSSETREGAVFSIRLPLDREHPLAQIPALPHPSMSGPAEHPSRATGLRTRFSTLLDRSIPPSFADTPDKWLRARGINTMVLSIMLAILSMIVLRSLFFGWDHLLFLPLAAGILCIALPFLMWRTGAERLTGGLLVIVLGVLAIGAHAAMGYFPAPPLLVFPVVVLLATLFVGPRLGLIAAITISLVIVGLSRGLSGSPPNLPSMNTGLFLGTALIGLVLTYIAAHTYDSLRARAAAKVKRRKRELERTRIHAEKANLAKSAFLSNMSREIRSPLDIVLGYADLLIETPNLEPNYVRDLRRIRTSGQHLLDLINEILDLSRIESGHLEINRQEVLFAELLAIVDDTIRPLADKNDNRLEIELAEGLGTITTDGLRLRQILVNLLSNACKFTNDGLVSLVIERAPGNTVDLHIRDQGIGMSKAQLGRIFDPFVQVGTEGANAKGTGLGLTITQRLCEQLGGTIHVTSEPGVGSEFTVRLPG